jgi:hypothetical protein
MRSIVKDAGVPEYVPSGPFARATCRSNGPVWNQQHAEAGHPVSSFDGLFPCARAKGRKAIHD